MKSDFREVYSQWCTESAIASNPRLHHYIALTVNFDELQEASARLTQSKPIEYLLHEEEPIFKEGSNFKNIYVGVCMCYKLFQTNKCAKLKV